MLVKILNDGFLDVMVFICVLLFGVVELLIKLKLYVKLGIIINGFVKL